MSKTLRTKCLNVMQKLARIKAADDNGYVSCFTCGVTDHYKNMDGGHFIAKGGCSRWALEEENIHPQCKGCNGFRMKHGTAAQSYTLHMIDFYGRDFVDNMLATKNEVKKMYKADYEDLLKYANEEIRYHEKRIGE